METINIKEQDIVILKKASGDLPKTGRLLQVQGINEYDEIYVAYLSNSEDLDEEYGNLTVKACNENEYYADECPVVYAKDLEKL